MWTRAILVGLAGCASAAPTSAHPEWGQCGYAVHQHLVARDDAPKCVAGDADACLRAADVYRVGGYSVPRVPSYAVELEWRACRVGDARGCSLLEGDLGEPPGTCDSAPDACASLACAKPFGDLPLSSDARAAMQCR